MQVPRITASSNWLVLVAVLVVLVRAALLVLPPGTTGTTGRTCARHFGHRPTPFKPLAQINRTHGAHISTLAPTRSQQGINALEVGNTRSRHTAHVGSSEVLGGSPSRGKAIAVDPRAERGGQKLPESGEMCRLKKCEKIPSVRATRRRGGRWRSRCSPCRVRAGFRVTHGPVAAIVNTVPRRVGFVSRARRFAEGVAVPCFGVPRKKSPKAPTPHPTTHPHPHPHPTKPPRPSRKRLQSSNTISGTKSGRTWGAFLF